MKIAQKEHKIFLIFLLLTCLSQCNSLMFSQVTIGSGYKPNKGSLLDLKEHEPNENNITSTKGLSLPRVMLKKLDGNLSETLGATEIYSNEEHAGLMIYNITDSLCPTFKPGIYVWDGFSWNSLSTTVVIKDAYSYTEKSDGTGIVTDYEGYSYTTKRFKVILADGSEYNQVWMTQNLRSLKTAEGLWVDCPTGVYINPAYNGSGAKGVNVSIEIPDSIVGNYTNAGVVVTNQSYNEFLNEFGLLYTSSQAQRACPKGWHLPSFDEWKSFLDALGGADNVGHILKAKNGQTYSPVGNAAPLTWGVLNTSPSGFNAVPSGYVDPGTNKSALYFGRYAGFHGINSIVSINYNLIKADLVTRTNSGFHYSVRCIKD